MRIVSLVPSWTETLIECGVEVVGRTRFCIHPETKIKSIEAVGGTKDIDWNKVKGLAADLIILDQDENPKWMADESPIPFVASHVRSIGDVKRDLAKILEALRAKAGPDKYRKLEALVSRWADIEKKPVVRQELMQIPAAIEWLNPCESSVNKIVYLIWQKPWMAASKNTFIGSVFEKLGYGWAFSEFEKPYPEIEVESFDRAKTLFVFSSEPFPFHKQRASLMVLPFAKVIVDGAAYSWFGLRSLEFLERELKNR